jgi:hypothetical protein
MTTKTSRGSIRVGITLCIAMLAAGRAAPAQAMFGECDGQESDCQSMSSFFARRMLNQDLGRGAGSPTQIRCWGPHSATLTFGNGDEVFVQVVPSLKTASVVLRDSFSGLPMASCAYNYTCPGGGLSVTAARCSP